MTFAFAPVWGAETFGDWSRVCGADIGPMPWARSTPDCVLVQESSGGTFSVRAIVGGITATGAPAAVFVISPPPSRDGGVGFLVDGRRLGAGWVEECTETSCESELLLDTLFLPAFRRGHALTLRVYNQNLRVQPVRLSLTGFSRGFAALGFK